MGRDGIIINYMKPKAASFIPKTRDESDQPNDDSRLYLASGTVASPLQANDFDDAYHDTKN